MNALANCALNPAGSRSHSHGHASTIAARLLVSYPVFSHPRHSLEATLTYAPTRTPARSATASPGDATELERAVESPTPKPKVVTDSL